MTESKERSCRTERTVQEALWTMAYVVYEGQSRDIEDLLWKGEELQVAGYTKTIHIKRDS